MTIQTPHPAFEPMRRRWRICDDLLGGTLTMRERGELYLPRSPKEPEENYKLRLSLAYLSPGYEKALSNYIGRAFASEPAITTNMPMEWMEDCDLRGTAFTAKMRFAFFDALNHGLTHFLVDSPRGPQQPTVYDQQRYNIRPYVVQINSEDVFAWKGEYINNRLQLTHLRYYEHFEVDDDDWNRRQEKRVRVIEPGRWARYTIDGELIEQGETSYKFIPIVTANVNPTGFMTARPLNEALAYVNAAHFATSCDQRWITRFSRIPIGIFKGVFDGEADITLSPGRSLVLPQGVDFEWAETSGMPAQVGLEDVKMLEDEMNRLALEPLLPTTVSGDRTATEAMLGDMPMRSRLETATLIYKDALEQVLALMAKIGGILESPDTGVIDMKGNFALPANSADIVNLQADVREGRITHETYLKEARRRNFLSDDIDIEREIELAGDQALLSQAFDFAAQSLSSPSEDE